MIKACTRVGAVSEERRGSIHLRDVLKVKSVRLGNRLEMGTVSESESQLGLSLRDWVAGIALSRSWETGRGKGLRGKRSSVWDGWYV